LKARCRYFSKYWLFAKKLIKISRLGDFIQTGVGCQPGGYQKTLWQTKQKICNMLFYKDFFELFACKKKFCAYI